ncbi:MAG: hypothetical protein NC827_08520 [Candidatus Omnitrophica bacterium]|nr:hypothetical protein [Candidatus Omnitrophota bacterium]
MKRKEFHSFQDWINAGVNISLDDKQTVYRRMKALNLPCVEMKTFNYQDLYNTNNDIKEFIEKYKPILVTASPKERGHPRKGRFDIATLEDLHSFIKELTPLEKYDITLIQMVQGIEDGYVGTAISDGYGGILLEILKENYITDVRELTSTGCDPNKISRIYAINGRLIKTSEKVPFSDVRKIIKSIEPLRGYFEFVKGKIKNNIDIFFTDFQTNELFIQILKDLEYVRL